MRYCYHLQPPPLFDELKEHTFTSHKKYATAAAAVLEPDHREQFLPRLLTAVRGERCQVLLGSVSHRRRVPAWTRRRLVRAPEPRRPALLPHGREHVAAVAYPPHGHLLLLVVHLNRMYPCNTHTCPPTRRTVNNCAFRLN
jgi:hypothetical protein